MKERSDYGQALWTAAALLCILLMFPLSAIVGIWSDSPTLALVTAVGLLAGFGYSLNRIES